MSKKKSKNRRSKRKSYRYGKRKKCRFCQDSSLVIDYKDVKLLQNYMSDRGKIAARRVTGNCAKHQRELARAIRRSRFLALVPYTVDIYR